MTITEDHVARMTAHLLARRADQAKYLALELLDVTFDEQDDGKTVLTLRQLHPTVEQRDGGIGIGAVELGQQTLRKLAHHLGVA